MARIRLGDLPGALNSSTFIGIRIGTAIVASLRGASGAKSGSGSLRGATNFSKNISKRSSP
jgi:hypothetical protein